MTKPMKEPPIQRYSKRIDDFLFRATLFLAFIALWVFFVIPLCRYVFRVLVELGA